MKILKNKRGDIIISVYWFAILFIVAGAVVYMTGSFYGNPYDVRELEANALTNKAAGCVSESGHLKNEILTSGLEACDLNFQTEDIHGWQEQEQYYLEINILDFNSKQQVSQISEGNENLKEFCEMHGKNFPVCLERSFYVVDRGNSQYQVDIISIVRKTEKNVQ